MSRDAMDRPPDEGPSDLLLPADPSYDNGFDPQDYLFRQVSDQEWKAHMRHLWRFSESRVCRYAWPVRRRAPAYDDITSMVLLKLLSDPSIWKPQQYQRHLEPAAALRAFAFQLVVKAVRKVWDWKDTQWMEDHNVDPNGNGFPDFLDTLPGSEPSPEDRMEQLELEDRIERMEDFSIERGYGSEFLLYFRLQMKPREIAVEMGLPVERVHQRLAQLKALLRKHFAVDRRLLFGDDEDTGDHRHKRDGKTTSIPTTRECIDATRSGA